MAGAEMLALVAATIAALGFTERWAHRRKLNRIQTRIHVSGTRGKSSVTRLIAAGLRQHGVSTAAKTTGTLARMILPDAREIPVFRPAGANIIEQTRIVATAADLGVQALVLECMALQPEYHWISESRLVRATHGVITNARADHLDVMGPTSADVARCLAGMIPVKGVLFTAERRHLDILREAAADRQSRLVTVEDEDLAAVTDEQLARFPYSEHRENVALTLKVLSELGVPTEVALAGMWRANPDPGAMMAYELEFFGRRIVFVNGFAANDPESTETIWHIAKARYPEVERVVAVFNLRADRPTRTVQLARDTAFWREADSVILMGTGAYLFARIAAKAGMNGKLVFAEYNNVEEIFEAIVEACGRSTLVIGMANIGGQGLGLVRYFRNRAVLGPLGGG